MKQGFALKNIIIACAAVIGVIATFLPWATASVLGLVSISVNGVADGASDGWFTMIAFIAIAVIAGIFMQKKDMHIGAKIGISVASALPVIIGIINIANVSSKTSGLGSPAIGLFLLVIAGIATAVLPWIPINLTIGGQKSTSTPTQTPTPQQ